MADGVLDPGRSFFAGLREQLIANPRRPIDLLAFMESGEAAGYPFLVVGNRSLYDMTGKEKLLCREDWPCGDWEIGRPYLQAVFAQRSELGMSADRVPWSLRELALLDVPHPLHFTGRPVRGNLAYLDVRRAYWSLYHQLSLDVSYQPWGRPPRLALGRLRFLHAGTLARHRGARNALVGVARSRRMAVMRYGRIAERPSRNIYLAPALWGYLAHALHAMAADAVHLFGAVYVHTDGYIVPMAAVDELVGHFAETWRVRVGVKAAGRGVVRGVGRWRIEEADHLGDVQYLSPTGQFVSNLVRLSPALRRAHVAWRQHLPEPLGEGESQKRLAGMIEGR